jgi:hypothetical protein
MVKRIIVCHILLLTLLTAVGCTVTAVNTQPSITTAVVPSATPPATATIIWFPATATYTPFPSPTQSEPTPDQHPGIGSLLLEDDFSDSSLWELRQSTFGSIAPGKNELTIAVQDEKTYLTSLRKEPELTNFYSEITTNPTLCLGVDEYGLLIRGSSIGYYRFSLSCDGQVRLDRIHNGEAAALQLWTPSGEVPIGAPSISRLGVWAKGQELRLFINDKFQFSVRDPLLSIGRMGIFARSTGDHSLTVNFSNLVVYQLQGE